MSGWRESIPNYCRPSRPLARVNCVVDHGVVTVWKHGVVTVWKHGVVTVWKHGVVTVWKHGGAPRLMSNQKLTLPSSSF